MSEGDAKAPPELDVAAAAAAENGSSNDDAAQPAKLSAYDKTFLKNLNTLKPCIKEDGSIDYSSLDDETQKRMQSFVKDQRKCYRKRENNEPSPMTDERFRLLSEAKFNFKPSDKIKARAQEKKKKKTKAVEKDTTPKQAGEDDVAPKKKEAATPKSDDDESGTPAKAKVVECVERADPTPQSSAKKSAEEADVPASDSKTPAKKSPKGASKSESPTPRKKSGKATYLEMVHEAIVTLKDRTGSSQPAISKWILANHEHASSAPPNMFKSRMAAAIKQGMKEGRFTKVKNSFKINAEWTKKQKAAARAKEAAKKKAERDRQREAEKKKKADAEKKREEEEKKRAEEEKKRKEKELTPEELAELERKRKLKEEAEARKKFIAEQLRKRRYPIEDTRLHKEDKEWGVKRPDHVSKRPALPHTLTCLVPPHLRAEKKNGTVSSASASGNGSLMGGDNERGLITDSIHVYHFFCGDVGLDDENYPVPKFSFKTLLYALDEVLNGNARAAKSLPPLLTHLFVTALRMLTAPPEVVDEDAEAAQLEPVDLRLQQDLSKLQEGLNVVGWCQTCFFYLDLMERYYTSDVSLEDGVLASEDKLDMSYYWDSNKMEVDAELKSSEDDAPLPNRYKGYLGDAQGLLAKVYWKMQNQNEPWTFKADELMALLRTLTDDVLARRPELAEDIAGRSAKLHELSKAKRTAVMKFNKVRLAYEGPKKPTKPKKVDANESKPEDEADGEAKAEDEKPFVPTATKKQFDAAEKAYIKAVEAYENGMNKLIARTEPVGFDRNFNAIYFFRHDPSMLHIEQLKQSSIPPEVQSLGPELTPFSSWHFIDTKPLFEQFLESLDKRGHRENETLEICSNLVILKRRLQDEKKENTRALAREREKEALERRLENAKSACDAEDGRRSGRLAGMAQGELKKVEEEIKQLTRAHEEEERQEKLGREKASDYSLLTGLQMVTELFAGQRVTRKNKKSDDDDKNEAALLATAPPTKLWLDDRIGGNGTLQILVEALLSLEDRCNELSPWTRHDLSREDWRKRLNDAACAWVVDCVMELGPSADEADDMNSHTSPNKKQKVETSSGTSLASIVTVLKNSLKDLEMRVFEVSGKKKSIEEADTIVEDDDDTDEEDEELTKRRNCWKIKINALKRVHAHRYALIRDILIAAIAVARKSHLNQVAAELKTALQLIRPDAGKEGLNAALATLEKYGGYDGSDDEDEDFGELIAANTGEANANAESGEDAEITSLLCDEVRMISGSVGGDAFADKTDWSDAIRGCKSVSRFAVMLQSFLSKADGVVKQLKEDRDKLDSVLGINAKRTGRSSKAVISSKFDTSTPIWCNMVLTDKLVKARVQGYPMWPARVCTPRDEVIAEALEGSGYAIISSVGNEGMFLVPEKDMVDFAEETDEDLSQYDKALLGDLHDSMAIAKKLWRVRNRGVASPWSKKSRPRFVEEKKSDSA